MHEKSVDLLNSAVADELAAIHQYMYFHFHCDDQGFDLLASLFKKTAIEEMLHTEQLAERILFLKGDVVMKPNADVTTINDVAEMLAMALKLEEDAVKMYNEFANECGANADSVSKKLFEGLVVDEERHFDHFDTQQEHLKKFGEKYLVLQSLERTRMVAGSGGQAE